MSLDVLGLGEFRPEDNAGAAPADTVSIGALLAHATPVHWDEAVAIVQSLLDLLTTSGKELPVPRLDDVCIHAGGTVAILPTGRGDRGPAAAARTLHALLSGNDVPVALRLFVSQATAPETYASLQEFAAGLAYYGKPGRADLIQAVYRRYAAAHNGRTHHPAPTTVRAVEPEPIRNTEPARRTSSTGSRWRPPSWVVPVVLTVVALGVGVWVLSKAEFGSAQTVAAGGQAGSPAAVAESPAGAVSSGEPSARPANGDRRSATAAKAPIEVTSVPRQSAVTARGRVEVVALPSAPVATGAQELEPSAAVPSLSSTTPFVAAETDRVYSGDDSDVQPPTMRYPQLPAPLMMSSSRSERVNRMEILVATDGSVERVRLVGIPARMPDMMLLSGAKLWRFSPALKDGEPVRYRTFVTWSGFP